MRKPSEGPVVLLWILCWPLGPPFDLSKCLNAYVRCFPEGGDLLGTFMMFYHLDSTRNKIGQLNEKDWTKSSGEHVLQSDVLAWDRGYELVARGRVLLGHWNIPTCILFSGCPLWCPVLNPLSSSAVFTWMILLWGRLATLISAHFPVPLIRLSQCL